LGAVIGNGHAAGFEFFGQRPILDHRKDVFKPVLPAYRMAMGAVLIIARNASENFAAVVLLNRKQVVVCHNSAHSPLDIVLCSYPACNIRSTSFT
jgi:hypothetical protein